MSASSWSAPATVAGFVRAAPNPVLLDFAAGELARCGGGRALDLGCGAARNAVPLGRQGWRVTGTDLSLPMLVAAAARAHGELPPARLGLVRAPMDRLPLADAEFDLVIAHGIWNLAASGAELRRALAEAARVARPGAGLFVFTFSRSTLPAAATPVAGERFVYTGFAGVPQVFLSAGELDEELAAAGFAADAAIPRREYNVPRPLSGGPPAIWEATYRRRG